MVAAIDTATEATIVETIPVIALAAVLPTASA